MGHVVGFFHLLVNGKLGIWIPYIGAVSDFMQYYHLQYFLCYRCMEFIVNEWFMQFPLVICVFSGQLKLVITPLALIDPDSQNFSLPNFCFLFVVKGRRGNVNVEWKKHLFVGICLHIFLTSFLIAQLSIHTRGKDR